MAGGAILFFTWLQLSANLHVLLFPSSESRRCRPQNQAGGRVVYRTYLKFKASNSLHSPGRCAYHNYKERFYEPVKCQGGSDGSAGIATL